MSMSMVSTTTAASSQMSTATEEGRAWLLAEIQHEMQQLKINLDTFERKYKQPLKLNLRVLRRELQHNYGVQQLQHNSDVSLMGDELNACADRVQSLLPPVEHKTYTQILQLQHTLRSLATQTKQIM